MKQKFGGRKSSTSDRNEQPAPSSQQASASASNRSQQPARSSLSSSQPANAHPKSGFGREKPSQPALNEQNLTQFYAEPLPGLKDVPNADKQNLFVRKLHLCSFNFDFTDGSKHVREKEMKRQTLVELLDYVSTETGKFTETVSEDVMFMISSNLFRALPPTKQSEVDNLDPEEEEPSFEPSWPHIQV